MRRSGRGSTFSALQSRGGDGFSRMTPALLELTHRLPVHEVRDGCGGRSGPLWVTQVPRLSPQRLGEHPKRLLLVT